MTGWERKSGGKAKITYAKNKECKDDESNSFSVDSIHSKKDKEEADSVMESSHSSALSSESRE